MLPRFTIWDEEDINATNTEMGRRNKEIVIGAKPYEPNVMRISALSQEDIQ
jgi:hypothetical protein